MLKKLNALMVKVFLMMQEPFVNEPPRLRDDERGVSPVVATVLLIVVAILAALVLWNMLNGYITSLFTNIREKDDELFSQHP